ncbi:Phage virion morphogenesis family protein [Gimesia panareensis]|uniref:Phage virion morphogenesis family protein n=1 Tax=Gimesia panareensis TaxID=2527978 RepID=A0A517QFR4_9PLAN|nr:phage virion morphogenesis protein [Gimesia panareensis]QDT30480.1 Phage virion morphogenesis family protein [Gimesia panareensis]
MPETITEAQLGDFLQGIADAVTKPDVPDAMQAALGVTKGDLAAGFQTSTAPDGSPWAPLKTQRPPGHNPDPKPLIDTGRLQDSVGYQGSDHIEGVSGEGFTLGTSVYYAGVHQEGSQKKNIPARKFMGFSEETLDTTADLTADSIVNQINKL